ncbi:MAG: mechanosensitive ion channel family protein [Actinomycetota bacterium]|nr:mechanosensitive ion channel family protein [Actinomycetota bacterium]MDQ6946242.1 mechanosensitive ion channel family protein [Actinomycetota bacterium]
MSSLVAAGKAGAAVVSRGLTLQDWAIAGVVLVGAVVLGWALKSVLLRAIHRGDTEGAAAEAVSRAVGSIVAVIGIIWGLSLVGVRLGPLVGALGIGGVALAFAAQAILANFLGSIILQVRRPFRRGDQISSGSSEGTVVDVNFRTVVLRTFDGQRVLVPCTDVLNHPIVNHTALGRRRTTLTIGVGYDCDLQQARKVLVAAVEATEGVLKRPPPEVWVEAFGESSISLAVRFWHAPDIATLWRVRNDVAISSKQALDDAGISRPFPNGRFISPITRRSRLKICNRRYRVGGCAGDGDWHPQVQCGSEGRRRRHPPPSERSPQVRRRPPTS